MLEFSLLIYINKLQNLNKNTVFYVEFLAFSVVMLKYSKFIAFNSYNILLACNLLPSNLV